MLTLLGFFGYFHVYVLRVNLSIAIVAMTVNRSSTDSNGTITYERDFDWNSKEQGMILGSFFYGYVTTQILAGFLAPIVGAARLYGIGIVGSGILTLVIPTAAFYGYIPLMIVRLLIGILEGLVFPSMHELLSHWAPPMERTKHLAIATSGVHVGTFVTMGVSGVVAEHLGWAWIFYIFGCTTILWWLIWFNEISEEPSKDKKISQEELEYLTGTIDSVHRAKFSEAPWRSILTSVPIWAAVTAHTVQNTGSYTLLTQMPTFLNDVYGWRLDKMGMLVAIPYITVAIVLQFAGILADTLRGRYGINTGTVRKMFTSGAFVVEMVFLLLTARAVSIPAVITCLSIAVGIGGFTSYSVNYLDLGPQYASLPLGFSNPLATLPGVFTPTITGYIVQNKLASEWHTVFYFMAGVYLFGAIFYGAFGSGERQPWAIPKTVSGAEESTDQ